MMERVTFGVRFSGRLEDFSLGSRVEQFEVFSSTRPEGGVRQVAIIAHTYSPVG